jgi:TolB-like protein
VKPQELNPAAGEEVAFGDFRLDLERRTLTRDGATVLLKGRPLDVLCVLAEARGETVSKDTLLARVWPNTVVEENNLQVHISALRRVLDQGSAQTHLVTVPGRGYRLIGMTGRRRDDHTPRQGAAVPAIPDKPSIAVLPFTNISGDPEQEYFADGMVEDIITALSRVRWLFVIARNSSFVYKGRTVDIKQVGAELGVRYVLEGSVRKAANRIRITGQLIDTSNGAHLWAERFDGALDDIFELQDQVTSRVVGAIAPKLQQAEIERAKRKPTESLDAYDCYLRGIACTHRPSQEATSEALQMFARAIELDPDFAAAYGGAALCYVLRKLNGWPLDRADMVETDRLATRAGEFGQDDATALTFAGLAVGYVVGDSDRALRLIDRARELNPNLATAWYASGTMRTFRGGEPDVAIEHLTRAMRLSPFDPFTFGMQGMMALAHVCAGRYDEAADWAEKSCQERPNVAALLRGATVANALAGRQHEAERALARLRVLDPELRVRDVRNRVGTFGRPEDLARYEEGLRRAGLPE